MKAIWLSHHGHIESMPDGGMQSFEDFKDDCEKAARREHPMVGGYN